MVQLRVDRVFENSTTTGTGAYILSGVVSSNYITFSTAGAVTASTFEYSAEDTTNGGYETGLGTYDATANSITRTTIYTSSNTTNGVASAVTWVAGTRRIALSITATTVNAITTSMIQLGIAIVNTQNALVRATT